MRKPNRKCCLCSFEYYYCPSCSDGKEPTWKVLFDNENCKKIFNTLTQYNFKHITTEEARNELINCDLDVNMNDRDKNTVKEIMNVTVIEEIMTAPIEEVTEEVVEDTFVETTEVTTNEVEAVEKVKEESFEEQKPETITRISRKNRKK